MSLQPLSPVIADIGDAFDTFLACWQSLPRSHHVLLPARDDCTPMRLGPFLPHIGIGYHEGPGMMQVRYYGSALEHSSGFHLTGRNYYDLMPAEFQNPTARFHHLIFTTPCGAFLAEWLRTEAGNEYLYQSLHLPLTDHEGVPRYLMVYGLGRKPFEDKTGRAAGTTGRRAVKEMRYLDLGAGAPTACIRDFIFSR